ncbi:MAG: DEAD/DEAH box helicase [bacterium]
MTFGELQIPPALVEALSKQGISVPMPIQADAVPALLAGKDAYINSETGTGKTLAYLLPIFCRVEPAREAAQAVIVAPTHELAIQIQRQACDLAQNSGMPVRTLLLIGGTLMQRQVDKLKKKPQIIVGSPGRILDLIGMGKLKVQAVRTVVIDEADRQLEGDGLAPVLKIIAATPAGRQLVFVSATEQPECAAEVERLAPGLVMLRTGAAPVNSNIEHSYLPCRENEKIEMLRKLLNAMQPERAIVFVHRNADAELITIRMAERNIEVADLHGAFDKSERKKAMDDFRSGRVRVLIASDLAARGLDISGVTHIFNYDMPTESKAYLHRVGRTARAGAKGYAIALMTEQDSRLVRRYETELRIRMARISVREGRVTIVDAPERG